MIGLDLNAQGWIEADLALRAMTGTPTVANAYPLYRIAATSSLFLDEASSNNSSWYSGAGTVDEFFEGLWRG